MGGAAAGEVAGGRGGGGRRRSLGFRVTWGSGSSMASGYRRGGGRGRRWRFGRRRVRRRGSAAGRPGSDNRWAVAGGGGEAVDGRRARLGLAAAEAPEAAPELGEAGDGGGEEDGAEDGFCDSSARARMCEE